MSKEKDLIEIGQYTDWPIDCHAIFMDGPNSPKSVGNFAGTDINGHPYMWVGDSTSRTQIVFGPKSVGFKQAIRIKKE